MTGTPISLRALATAVAALVALLAAGVLTLGVGGAEPAAAQPGCSSGPFAFDAAEQGRQRAFEARLGQGADLPALGFHTTAPDLTATLHAATHAYVVVFYRPGSETPALKALAADATAFKVPLIVAPREQQAALVAIAQGTRLECAAPRVDSVRALAAGMYADLAA